MSAPELKPCAFCGTNLISTQDGDGFTHDRRLKAAKHCMISWVVVRMPHFPEWNTRVPTEADALRVEIERLREALEWLDRTVEGNCTPTGAPARIKDESGNWHSGPAADVVQKVLRGLQSVARAALEEAKP